MQTPSHIAFSLFAWRKAPNWKITSAIVFGAILPDAAMFLFYAYQKSIGSSESDIWQHLYFLESWQLFFDVFNSIPIFVALAVVGHYCKWDWLYFLSASATLHLLCDLPLHNDDAHRHFLPFTNWRFISPVSYWDPKHFGIYALSIEMILAITACTVVATGKHIKSIRISAWTNLCLFIAAGILAIWIWLSYQS